MEQGKSGISICSVPPALIDVIWDKIKPHIHKAIDESYGDLDETNVKERLRSGQEIAMVFCDGPEIISTGIVTVSTLDTGRRVLYIPSLGGERMSEWFEEGYKILKQLEQQYGCEGIRACGRPGWARQIPNAKAIHQIVEF